MSAPRVLVTGAAGGVGSALWPQLRAEFDLRLFDRDAIVDAPSEVEVVVGDVTDHDDLRAAMSGVAAVVHLAGNRFATAPWAELVQPNIVGVQTVLAAAEQAGVTRVVLASSCHASGGYDAQRVRRVDPAWLPRPCCPYGVSKVFAETAGRWFAEHTELQVLSLRLGAVSQVPYSAIGVPFWLSLGDLFRIVSGALHTTVKSGTYLAGSANARDRWNLEPGERDLGFVPLDDSADYLSQIDFSVPVPDCYRDAV